MIIIGMDYHPSFQQVAFCNQETSECGEARLNHSDGEAERFYRDLKQRGISVRVGMEATGYSRWFERLLAELGFELWIGNAAEIKIKRVRKQKTDRNGRTEADRKIAKRALVVDAEATKTKTALCGVNGEVRSEKPPKDLDRADAVRDVWLRLPVQTVVATPSNR